MESRAGPWNEAIRDDRRAPPAMTSVLTRGGDTHTEERPWGRGGDGSEASAGPGAPEAPRTRGRQGPDSLSQPAGGTSPPDTSLPDSGLPNHERLNSCYSQPPALWAQQPWDRKAASPRSP